MTADDLLNMSTEQSIVYAGRILDRLPDGERLAWVLVYGSDAAVKLLCSYLHDISHGDRQEFPDP